MRVQSERPIPDVASLIRATCYEGFGRVNRLAIDPSGSGSM